MRFCRPSRILGENATVTSSTAMDAEYPLTNLHDLQPIDPARWTTGAETRLVWDHGTAVTIEGLLVVMHTLAAGKTVKVQANGTNAWGSPSYSLDIVVPAWPDHLPPNLIADLRATTMATAGYRYTSLLLPSSTANHALGEVCWIGEWDEPEASARWPVLRGERRRVSVNSTAYGVDHTIDRLVRQRRLRPRFEVITDADRELWLRLVREAGGDLAFPIVVDVHETTDFHSTSEALLVRFMPDTVNDLEEQLAWYGRTDLQLDLLEVQRGLPL